MANLEKRGNRYRIVFRFGRRKYARTLKTCEERAANASLARAEDTLRRLELGTLLIPPDVDLATLVVSDGLATQKPAVRQLVTLKELFTAYFDGLPEGCLETVTIDGMKIHERLLTKRFGARFEVQSLTAADLQNYIAKRSKDRGRRGKKVTAVTIRKAIVTFRTVWNWGVRQGLLHGKFPNGGLQYPKGVEKPPFMTYEEIERLVKATPKDDQAGLWDSLFLTLPEVEAVLEHVKTAATLPFIYPMFVFVAHTGARRAEILRSKVRDIDFRSNMVTIHERKKAHDRITTRRVPMSSRLAETMKDWLAIHPGGEHTFCHSGSVAHSKSRRTETRPITRDEAHDHFKRPLANSKWERIRGFHVFRHSFCSNCAAQGIDQRIINGWVGHLSDEMVRRYRHLLPDQQQKAIATVFP